MTSRRAWLRLLRNNLGGGDSSLVFKKVAKTWLRLSNTMTKIQVFSVSQSSTRLTWTCLSMHAPLTITPKTKRQSSKRCRGCPTWKRRLTVNTTARSPLKASNPLLGTPLKLRRADVQRSRIFCRAWPTQSPRVAPERIPARCLLSRRELSWPTSGILLTAMLSFRL